MFKFFKSKIEKMMPARLFIVKGLCLGVALFALIYFVSSAGLLGIKYDSSAVADVDGNTDTKHSMFTPPPAVLDTIAYNQKLNDIANNDIPAVPVPPAATDSTTSTNSGHASSPQAAPATPTSSPAPTPQTPPPPPQQNLWPVKTATPKAGALLPFHRIVAYYGNFYSTKMGVLGEYATDTMLQKLNAEVESWKAADPETPVIPAIDYIAITAQGSPGADGKYRFRMPFDQIDHAVDLAHQINGIVFLDLQVGLSNVQTEIPLLEKYLKMPNVHLALDPEFSMKTGAKPGTVIGTLDAADINFAANYLATLVKDNNVPPKILVVHRFTLPMVTHYKQIMPLPEVQMVMDMDGWGFGAKKINTYQTVVYAEPVQFTGFKLFYKNDLKAPSTRMLTPAEILALTPQPVYIQYQ